MIDDGTRLKVFKQGRELPPPPPARLKFRYTGNRAEDIMTILVDGGVVWEGSVASWSRSLAKAVYDPLVRPPRIA